VSHFHSGNSGIVGPKTGQHLFELFSKVVVKPGVQKGIITSRRHGRRVSQHEECSRIPPESGRNIEVLNLFVKRRKRKKVSFYIFIFLYIFLTTD
jgi:hypothetical protein